MNHYYIYALIDPRNNKPFYIGKGSGNRAEQHLKFKDGNGNKHKDRVIKNILKNNLEVKIKYLKINIINEEEAYNEEEKIIKEIGIDNLTNITENNRPPSKKNWSPSKSTLEKRSKALKGIPRTEKWRKNLSLSKKGNKNGMYGKKNPCADSKKISIIKTKNYYRLDKLILLFKLLKDEKSIRYISKETGYGTAAIISIKKYPHLHFEAFPILKQFK